MDPNIKLQPFNSKNFKEKKEYFLTRNSQMATAVYEIDTYILDFITINILGKIKEESVNSDNNKWGALTNFFNILSSVSDKDKILIVEQFNNILKNRYDDINIQVYICKDHYIYFKNKDDIIVE